MADRADGGEHRKAEVVCGAAECYASVNVRANPRQPSPAFAVALGPAESASLQMCWEKQAHPNLLPGRTLGKSRGCGWSL